MQKCSMKAKGGLQQSNRLATRGQYHPNLVVDDLPRKAWRLFRTLKPLTFVRRR